MKKREIKYPSISRRAAIALENALRNGVVSFEFRKVSTGELRTVNGTKSFEFIPLEKQPKYVTGQVTKQRAQNPDILTFFDLNKKEWRSLRKDSITMIFK